MQPASFDTRRRASDTERDHRAGQAHALQGTVDRSLAALRQAIDEGWRLHTWYHFDMDPALDALRGTAAFDAMRDEVLQDLAEQAERLERLKASGEVAVSDRPSG